jgi:hypothetical protein
VKTVLGVFVGAWLWALAAPALASDAILVIEDPTPTKAFTGQYKTYCYAENDWKHKHPYPCERTQDGYVAVYNDGVVACNGNPAYAPYDQNGDGINDPLQGYIWVGANHQAHGDIQMIGGVPLEAPGGVAGSGSNHGKYPHPPTGKSPCEKEDPLGDGSGT